MQWHFLILLTILLLMLCHWITVFPFFYLLITVWPGKAGGYVPPSAAARPVVRGLGLRWACVPLRWERMGVLQQNILKQNVAFAAWCLFTRSQIQQNLMGTTPVVKQTTNSWTREMAVVICQMNMIQIKELKWLNKRSDKRTEMVSLTPPPTAT